MGKLKSSRLSYSLVESFPELSSLRRHSKYEVDFVDTVVALILRLTEPLNYFETHY